MSKQKSAALLANLKSQSGDIDILEKQMVLEQAIASSPLILGNKVILLQDGEATYAAMFAATLHKAGAKIHERHGAQLHAKTAVIDGLVVHRLHQARLAQLSRQRRD